MKKFLHKGLSLLLILALSVSLCIPTFAAELDSDFGGEVYNLVNSFGTDAKTTRNFAWTAVSDHYPMAIRYAKAGTPWEEFTEAKARVAGNTTLSGTNRSHYKADLVGLESGTTYEYRIGAPNEDKWSTLYSFTTEAENVDNFSFIVTTDTQGSNVTNYNILSSALTLAFRDVPDAKFIVTLGDEVTTATKLEQWKMYFDALGDYAAKLPIMTLVGNHDMHGDAQDSGYYYMVHFNNPANGGAKHLTNLVRPTEVTEETMEMLGMLNNINGSFYSFEYGDVHFSVLNTASDWYVDDCARPLVEAQKEWLENNLKNTKAKWKVVMLHQAVYPGASRDNLSLDDILAPVMDQYGVDLVLQGHDHQLIRTYPLKKGNNIQTEDPGVIPKGTGTVYLTPGVTGWQMETSTVGAPPYAYKYGNTEDSTFAYVKVSDQKLTVVVKDMMNKELDRFEIIDPNAAPAEPVSPAEPVTPAEPVKPAEPVVPAEKTFADVAENAWYYKAVTALAQGGLVNGLDETTFGPDGTLTYAQFCQILAKAKGMETGEEGGYWAGKAIRACIEAGYLLDRGDVSPANYDVAIPREAAVSAMYLAKKDSFTEAAKSLTLADIPDSADISAEYKDSIVSAYNYGITSGVDESYTFLPKKSLSRAEVCQLFYNLNWTSAD